MKVLYFTETYENDSFIFHQIDGVADAVETFHLTCRNVENPDNRRTKVFQVEINGPRLITWVKRRLELSDVYMNFRKKKFSRKIHQIINEVDPDIIHCQYGYDSLKLFENYFDPKRKFVVTFRGYDASMMLVLRTYRTKLNRYLSKPNVFPVFVCEALKKNLIENNISINHQHAIIHSNTDVEFYTRRRYDHSRETLTFVQISNYRVKKGHVPTIQAFEEFNKRHPEIKFVLNFVGDFDADSEKIIKYVQGTKIADMVFFLGVKNRSEIREILEGSHVFVHNSITSQFGDQEGIPNSIMEAMSMELPVLTTKHSGIPELIINKEDVFLSEEKNIDQYVQNIELAITCGYSKANRNRIVDSFSKESFKKSMLSFYNTILPNEPR